MHYYLDELKIDLHNRKQELENKIKQTKNTVSVKENKELTTREAFQHYSKRKTIIAKRYSNGTPMNLKVEYFKPKEIQNKNIPRVPSETKEATINKESLRLIRKAIENCHESIFKEYCDDFQTITNDLTERFNLMYTYCKSERLIKGESKIEVLFSQSLKSGKS